jgi:threonine dehydrogenase-like Zn-dependent dehydrogenase
MMRAAVVYEPGGLRVDEVPVPEPGPKEVRVRLEGCGVCASNIPPWEGRPWFSYPMEAGALGHEGWGRIDALGESVTALSPGERVAFISGHAYAEYDVAHESCVMRLGEVDADKPFPGEPLGCAMNIFNRAGIRAGETVAIIGIGFLGALMTRLAHNAAAHVIAISRRPFALDIARNMGASHAILMDDHWRIVEQVKELTGGEMCGCVIEAVGQQWPLDLAGELTKVRGRLVVAGYHQDGTRQVNMQMWNWRGLDVINAHERDMKVYADGMRSARNAVHSGHLDPSPLYTHRYPLEALADALNAARDRPDGFVKALIML